MFERALIPRAAVENYTRLKPGRKKTSAVPEPEPAPVPVPASRHEDPRVPEPEPQEEEWPHDLDSLISYLFDDGEPVPTVQFDENDPEEQAIRAKLREVLCTPDELARRCEERAKHGKKKGGRTK